MTAIDITAVVSPDVLRDRVHTAEVQAEAVIAAAVADRVREYRAANPGATRVELDQVASETRRYLMRVALLASPKAGQR